MSAASSPTEVRAYWDSATGTVTLRSAAEKWYANASAGSMFANMTNAESIDVSPIDTSLSSDATSMFRADRALESLDLSGFDLSGCTAPTAKMAMFYGTDSLAELKLGPNVFPAAEPAISAGLAGTWTDRRDTTYDAAKGELAGRTGTFKRTGGAVSYGLSGGQNAEGNPSRWLSGAQKTLADPTWSGHGFLGWTGSNDLSTGLSGYTEEHPETASDRDNTYGPGFAVTPGKTYRVFAKIKRTKGTDKMQGGLWYTAWTTGPAYDGYQDGSWARYGEDNGWELWYKDVTVPAGKSAAHFYLQFDTKAGSGADSAQLCDMHVVEKDAKPTVGGDGDTGDKRYTAHWDPAEPTDGKHIVKAADAKSALEKFYGDSGYKVSVSSSGTGNTYWVHDDGGDWDEEWTLSGNVLTYAGPSGSFDSGLAQKGDTVTFTS